MNLHANAALSLKGRRELCLAVVERQRTLAAAAEAAGVSVRCAHKWVGRYRAEGELGLRDRSSAPHRIPHRASEQRGEEPEAAGVSVRCAHKWVGRYRAEGELGLRDRSSAPHRIPHRTSEQRVEAIAALRRL